MKVNSRMYCHDCRENFTAELDMGINGNHEIECPHCGHIHYRVVENGKVTDTRYRSSMGTVSANTWTTTSGSYTVSSNSFTAQSWDDSSTSTTMIANANWTTVS